MGKPEGINRESFALLGASHPIVSSQGIAKKDASKSKVKTSKSVPTWQLKGFKNSARSDGLELHRWVKGVREMNGRIRDADDGEYYFARFNQKVQMYRYTPDEYDRLIAPDSEGWSRTETDYLMDLCERFDLRFTVIADRYELPGSPPRSVEALKERYYSIARRLLVSREGGESAVANHTLLRYPYNQKHETDRKQGVSLLLTCTPQQIQADNLLLAECKVIEDRRRAAAAAAAPPPDPAALGLPPSAPAAPALNVPGQEGVMQGGAAPPALVGGQVSWEPSLTLTPVGAEGQQPHLDFHNQLPPGVPSLIDMNLNPTKPPQPGVYFRSGCTAATSQAIAASVAGPSAPRVLKAVEQTLLDLGYGPLAKPSINTRAVSGQWLALRSEVTAMHEARKGGPPRPHVGMDDRKKGKRR